MQAGLVRRLTGFASGVGQGRENGGVGRASPAVGRHRPPGERFDAGLCGALIVVRRCGAGDWPTRQFDRRRIARIRQSALSVGAQAGL